MKKNYKLLIEQYKESKAVRETLERFMQEQQSVSVKYLPNSLKALFVASLLEYVENSFVILTANKNLATELHSDLSELVDEKKLALLAKPQKQKSDTEKDVSWYLDGLSNLIKNPGTVAILDDNIISSKLPNPNLIEDTFITLKRGQTIDFEDFTRGLSLNGFERRDYVAHPGEIAVRGGICDIYPYGWNNPIRIEFWGNEIDSIREFDSLSQRSINDHNEIEFIANANYNTEEQETDSSFVDYIPEDTIVIIDSPDQIALNADIPVEIFTFQHIFFNAMGKEDVNVKAKGQASFGGSVREFSKELRRLANFNTQLFICADGKIHLDRFRDIIEEALNYDEDDDLASPDKTFKSIKWLDESLSSGFALEEENLVLFTEHQVFERRKANVSNKNKNKAGITLKELKQLRIGDFVVHDEKGVGQFDGFETVELGGVKTDCVRLIYQGGDILYVHLNYLHKVQQYASQEGVHPKLNKLGSTEWARKKAKTKKRLKDIARDLIKLYAQRKSQPGYAFNIDSIWQKEFEASFQYEDTIDQAKATDEIKKDMESKTPMDRLVCGDVGFGKTEVAIRAAFKAVQSGKQVAVLVPTTILAHQHYMTFRDRLAKYPVMTEVISRFRKKADQTKILDGLKKGGVDILIGTHRMLSKDIDFKNLGLLIIDEEQRFGVGAKEKLRQMRVSVDTLTLTATPIPRTLNFSLMGARDFSIIATAPRNRLPVETEINEWHEEEIEAIIRKEVKRGGQVFFVSDKVQDLEKIMIDLQMLMPDIKFGLAHGQMKGQQLESIMQKFIQQKIDVLVATKIIESGIDIPNANTMIINRAHNFGLAELYQLRGRVGRTDIQAYCYLLIPQAYKMNPQALQRLQAIEEFTDLGSGFQLAMRDLEIRGSGDLLGPDQSGFINDMGFELYQKVLDEAVSELRIEEFSDLFDVEEIISTRFENEDIAIELENDALLPSNYVKDDTERFSIYKRLYKLRSVKELYEMVDEIKDKYGRLPKEVEELIFAVKVRIAAITSGFTRIIVKKTKMVAELPPDSFHEYYEIAFPIITEFLNEIGEAKLRQGRKKLFIDFEVNNRDHAVEVLWRLKKHMEIV